MADRGYQSSDINYADFYTGAMDPNKPYVQTPGALPYNTNLPLSTDARGGGLTTRSVQTVPIDPVTGAPTDALAQILINDARAGGALGAGMFGRDEFTVGPSVRDLGGKFYGTPGSGGGVLKAGLPPGSTTDKAYLDRLAAEGAPRVTTATSKPIRADNANGILTSYLDLQEQFGPEPKQPRRPEGGLFGIAMSPGMNRNLAGRAGIAGIPGLPPRIQVQQAQKAAIAQALVQGPQQPMFLPNGVANPGYRDYSPTYSSEGGGQMPAAAYGGNSGSSFTDSLGGTYYSRHL